jgi:hypothetical protein
MPVGGQAWNFEGGIWNFANFMSWKIFLKNQLPIFHNHDSMNLLIDLVLNIFDESYEIWINWSAFPLWNALLRQSADKGTALLKFKI